MPTATTKAAIERGLTSRRYQRADLSALLLAPLIPFAHTEPEHTAKDAVTEARRAIVNLSLLQQTAKYLQMRLGLSQDHTLKRRLDRVIVAIEAERRIRRQASGEV